jgi:hypothetical protein
MRSWVHCKRYVPRVNWIARNTPGNIRLFANRGHRVDERASLVALDYEMKAIAARDDVVASVELVGRRDEFRPPAELLL